MKVIINHYRVIDYSDAHRNKFRGRPNPEYLHRYCRGRGFLDSNPGFEDTFVKWEPKPRGGHTVCTIKEDEQILAVGIATCSYSDNFSYKIGRELATERALAQLDE